MSVEQIRRPSHESTRDDAHRTRVLDVSDVRADRLRAYVDDTVADHADVHVERRGDRAFLVTLE